VTARDAQGEVAESFSSSAAENDSFNVPAGMSSYAGLIRLRDVATPTIPHPKIPTVTIVIAAHPYSRICGYPTPGRFVSFASAIGVSGLLKK
jgi:hypothetical protein